MKTPEKIKKGLEYISTTNIARKVAIAKAGRMPYEYAEEAAADAFAYIRELEARLAEHEKPLKLMTLDEVVEKSKRVNDNVIWLERPDEEYGYDDAECIPALVSNHSSIGADCIQYVRFLAWPKREIVFDIADEDKDDYGKTWRCWSHRPTEEERKAAEWDER